MERIKNSFLVYSQNSPGKHLNQCPGNSVENTKEQFLLFFQNSREFLGNLKKKQKIFTSNPTEFPGH